MCVCEDLDRVQMHLTGVDTSLKLKDGCTCSISATATVQLLFNTERRSVPRIGTESSTGGCGGMIDLITARS